jgi:hypothetical protein
VASLAISIIYWYIAAQNNEELNDLYSLPNIVRVVKSRRMRWVGLVARMGEERGVHREARGKKAVGETQT